MYRTHRTYIKPDMKMSDLINENHTFLLMLEHLNVDFLVKDKTVHGICSENDINLPVFLTFANLYNGFYPSNEEINSLKDISMIIQFLENSHNYYKYDKYPEIKGYIKKLKEHQKSEDIKLIEKFFNDYFEEVLDHLDYEDKIAFPYFCQLIDPEAKAGQAAFSVNEYREHHSDIETKLTDLKNLLLKHIPLKNDLPMRRKVFFSLFELEYDLNIHSQIEEMILLPLVERIEKGETS